MQRDQPSENDSVRLEEEEEDGDGLTSNISPDRHLPEEEL